MTTRSIRRRLLHLALLTSGVLMILPATALADATTAQPQAAVSVSRVFRVHGQTVTVPGRWFQLSGVVRPYVAGQKVSVKALRHGHQFKTATLRLRPVDHGAA